ncbi:MAG TPA: prephenate dehydratase [Bryobacteraceae bacterium]|nr:prephenate dehydratase [Bryobacteraceae bacterium]
MAKRPMKAAFQGERGAFSQQAVRQLLGDGAEVLPCQRFEEVFQSLRARKVDAAVVPIENTLAGSVHENYDHLLHFDDFEIVAETSVRIVHNLIASPGVTFRKIRRVFSHPVALNQCLDFFTNHPDIERVPFYDTAGSVKMIMEDGLKDAAAIASALSAEIYGAKILKRSIEDDRRNYTRFFLLRRRDAARLAATNRSAARGWKTTLVFTTRNIPGTLFRALSAFALRDINLMKIESRPLRGKPWEYLFYLDFLGDLDEPRVQNALSHLSELADFLRVLGCYPRGE